MSVQANRRSVMALYADRLSPASHSVRIVLSEKDINVEIKFVDEDNRPEDLNALTPYYDVLTLIDRELVLYDAQIIMEYLDERYPHPPLMPVDPVSRANNRQVRYRVMRDLYELVPALTGENDIAAANGRKAMRDNLTAIAPAFSQKPYFLSDDYSLVDACLAPLLWRLPSYGVKLGNQAKPIIEYSERMFERVSFQSSLTAEERDFQTE